MDKLVNELTQKDEIKAQKAAASIINDKNIEAFTKLCEKTDFLFDFIKNNVRKRLDKAVNQSNYHNLIAFFDIYNEAYADTIIGALAKYATEELTDEIYEFLENGSISQKKYAAKYFSLIPDTIAQDLLEAYALNEDMDLAINSAQALGAMNDIEFYNSIITKLKTKDEFELIKFVRFLCAYGNKNAIPHLLSILENTTTAENIAGEIPYLMPFSEMLQTQDKDKTLVCFDFILESLGEIFSLGDIFFYEIYDVLQILIKEQNNQQTKTSHNAQVLLRALDKFTTFDRNDEYSFDESKDTKDELKEIYNLLNSQSKGFWTEQKNLISNELSQSRQRIISALETIQSLNIIETKDSVINFINTTTDEQLIVLAVGVAKTLNSAEKLDFSNLSQKISDETLKAILKSYAI